MAKVKITKTPGANIRPLYQQNPKTFALDTGGAVFMDKGDEGDFRTQYPEADRDEANIEVEQGENILTPDMENYSIGGKKHSQGGTPIKADPGSFIFSNDKSLKITGDILNEFGINPDTKKGRKGFTPAQIAKKYPTNKLLDLIRSKDSNKMDTDTAALSLDGMKKKLSKLAFVQESMKGFPNGIPDVAEPEQPEMKRGGLVKAQDGTEVPYQGGHNWRPRKYDQVTGKYSLNHPENWWYDPAQGKWIVRANVTAKYPPKKPDGSSTSTGTADLTEATPKIIIPKPPGSINPGAAAGIAEGISAVNPYASNGQSSGDPTVYSDPSYDTGYGAIDYVNMAAPFGVPIKKYSPIRTNVNAQHLAFNPIDLEAQRQSIKGQVGTAQEANNLLSPSASMASSRNAQLLGQGLDPLNQSFMTEFNTNQAARTQIEGQNAQFRQQTDLANAAADDQYNARNALTNENYDNERRLRLQQFLKGLNTAEKNRQVRNAGNVINQDFMITANGAIVRKPSSYDPARQFARITGGSSSGGGQTMSFEQYKSALPPDVQANATPWDLWKAYQSQMSATYRGKDAQGIIVSSRNPGIIPQPFDYSTLPD